VSRQHRYYHPQSSTVRHQASIRRGGTTKVVALPSSRRLRSCADGPTSNQQRLATNRRPQRYNKSYVFETPEPPLHTHIFERFVPTLATIDEEEEEEAKLRKEGRRTSVFLKE